MQTESPPFHAIRYALAIPLTCLALAAAPSDGQAAPHAPDAAAEFARIRNEPAKLLAFLRAFPKGADLHNHLAGAIYAEDMLDWAAKDGLCIKPATSTLTTTCTPDTPTVTSMAANDDRRHDVIDALSMRDFVPTATDHSGHDHFFATFGKFGAVEAHHEGDMLARAMQMAARDHVTYLELMVSPQLMPISKVGLEHPLQGEAFGDALQTLKPLIPALVAASRAETDAMEADMRQRLQCGTANADPACKVTVRYLFQTIRTMPPSALFAQLATGYATVQQDPRFVGINIVAPEDDFVAMRDYTLHMHMFQFLSAKNPDVKLSLHAGELALGLVPPEGLRSHIRQAVEIAGASRIGHGVDIAQEDDAPGLLAEMAKKHVMVEINLTSNDVILGVSGKNHPFPLYRASGVPVALSTDDEGVSRIDLTNEYLRAVTTWPLTYADLVDLSRTGLNYSFLPGDSIFLPTTPLTRAPACRSDSANAAPQSAACKALLAHSEKARAQWQLETQLAAFNSAPPAL